MSQSAALAIEPRFDSPRSAFAYGFTSVQAVIPTENIEHYQQFVANHIAEYRPDSAMHLALVTELADVSWRLRRFHVLEAQLVKQEMHAVSQEPDYANCESHILLALAYGRLIERKILTNLHAQEGRLNNRMYKIRHLLATMGQLRSQQEALRPKTAHATSPSVATPPPAQRPQNQPVTPFCKNEPIRVAPQPGRNELCPCGSGEKFKRCCLNTDAKPAKTFAAAA